MKRQDVLLFTTVTLAVGFFLGRASVRPDGLTIRRGSPGWIEVWRGGNLESEWGKWKDKELWGWLDKLLREDDSLYDRPKPSVQPREVEPARPMDQV